MGDLSSAKSMSLAPAIAAGLLSAFVGYASSVTIVIQGLAGVGASPDEVASGLLVLGLAMGLPAIWFSLKTRMPISIAWSTPGAALLAGTGIVGSGFGEAVGAFITVALLIVLTGLWPPFARAIGKIPTSIANALLAGVIFQLCLAPFKAVAELPGIALPVVLLWALVARINRYFAVPAAIVLAAVLLSFDTSLPALDWSKAVPAFVFTSPQFTWQATVSIALPLFLVTMASQNITGLAVLKASGYEPAPGPLFAGTGLASLITAPFGAVTVNLAAITAAICAGPDAHPDPGKRWVAALVAGLGYIAFGALAGIAAIAVLAAPPLVIEAVAGLALLGALAGSMKSALADDSQRTAALLTFLTTASGLAFAGIGSAFWGLIVGLFMLGLDRLQLTRS